MDIKGIAVVSTPKFVKKKFASRYEEWINSLPKTSRDILENQILLSNWYPIKDAIVIPTKKICELFYNNSLEGAKEVGRFSAEEALKGIYKVFIKIATPSFLASRATQVFSTYYRPIQINVVKTESNSSIIRITHFPEPDRITFLRISGWLEGALFVMGFKNANAEITKSLENGDEYTEFFITWS